MLKLPTSSKFLDKKYPKSVRRSKWAKIEMACELARYESDRARVRYARLSNFKKVKSNLNSSGANCSRSRRMDQCFYRNVEK